MPFGKESEMKDTPRALLLTMVETELPERVSVQQGGR
jgi:hypothetical protein